MKKEKEDAKRERDRLRAELAKDKAERKARGGKLAGRLAAEGYNPAGLSASMAQEDAKAHAAEAAELAAKAVAAGGGNSSATKNDTSFASVEERAEAVDKCIESLMKYKVGGDGGNALKVTTRRTPAPAPSQAPTALPSSQLQLSTFTLSIPFTIPCTLPIGAERVHKEPLAEARGGQVPDYQTRQQCVQVQGSSHHIQMLFKPLMILLALLPPLPISSLLNNLNALTSRTNQALLQPLLHRSPPFEVALGCSRRSAS